MKKLCLLTALALCTASFAACASESGVDAGISDAPQNEVSTTAETTEWGPGSYVTSLGALDFKGETVSLLTMQNPNQHFNSVSHEENGETLNDAVYKRTVAVEEKLNIKLEETYQSEPDTQLTPLIMAGDDAYDIANVRCTTALSYHNDGLTVDTDTLPNLDFSMPWWNAVMNDSLTIGNKMYIAMGSYNISTYDLTYAMIFNKDMFSDFGFEDQYAAVNNGSWTFDLMEENMKAVIADVDGDGAMTVNDRYGYSAGIKQVLPGFWIAAGEMSIKKDGDDMPQIAMDNERFAAVIERTFKIVYDNGYGYIHQIGDVPDDSIAMFNNSLALYMDVSMYHIEKLRSSEVDFGIIPYPKYNEAQSNYFGRVAYYIPTVVPITNDNLDMTGAVLETLMCESANTVVPAYYEIMLKGKYLRDNESSDMLDLILENCVVDIGDTTLCDVIRDGFIRTMFMAKQNTLASSLEANREVILERLDIFA